MASDGEGSRYDLPLWCSVASGTVGGACAVVVGYPFETIKVRLQTGATRRMWSQLFAGMGAPLATVTPQWAVMYAAYYNVQKYLGDKELGPVARGAVSGAACGFAVSFCAVPVDVVKINAQKMHVSAYESMRTLYKQRGLRFVAHGGVATVLHLTLSQMAFFATYELVLDRWERPPAHAPAVAGGLSGLVEWTLFMATDTVKTRVQAAAPGAWWARRAAIPDTAAFARAGARPLPGPVAERFRWPIRRSAGGHRWSYEWSSHRREASGTRRNCRPLRSMGPVRSRRRPDRNRRPRNFRPSPSARPVRRVRGLPIRPGAAVCAALRAECRAYRAAVRQAGRCAQQGTFRHPGTPNRAAD